MRASRKRLLLVFAPLVLAAAALVAIAMARHERAAGTGVAVTSDAPSVLELSPVEVVRLARQPLAEDLRVSGSLRPSTRAELTARMAGTVADIGVEVGDAVRQGQELARFDTRDTVANLAERRANLAAGQATLDLANLTLERTRGLAARGNASQVALQEAESQLASSRAQVEALKAQVAVAEQALRDAVLVAPFAGIVSSRAVEPGQRVGLDAQMLGVVDLATMEMEAGVPTSRVAQLSVGQAAALEIEGMDGAAFSGTVIRISPTAVQNTRAVPVYIAVANDAAQRLRGGMFATGRIRLRETPAALALPLEAIRSDDKGSFVLVVADGALQRRPVELGRQWQQGALQEVTAGLAEGDTVVVAPLPQLVPGQAVRIGSKG